MGQNFKFFLDFFPIMFMYMENNGNNYRINYILLITWYVLENEEFYIY